MTDTLTSIQSTADAIDSAVDKLAPIIGIFVPFTPAVKLAVDGLTTIIDVAIGTAKVWQSSGADVSKTIDKLTASKVQLQTALSDAQQLAQTVGARYPGDGKEPL